LPKIIEIGKYSFKLQLKMSGCFVETHCSSIIFYSGLGDKHHYKDHCSVKCRVR